MTTVLCPVCSKPVEWIAASRWRPFCSERCKTIDLGDWAAERRVIPGATPGTGEDAPHGEPPERRT